ncbi:MAG: 4-alpha-glucanotransferase [Saprospiraceae bacterium]
MKVQFLIRYSTQFGESLLLQTNLADEPVRMHYLNEEYWQLSLELPKSSAGELHYQYVFQDRHGKTETEWDSGRQIKLKQFGKKQLRVVDYWNNPGTVDNAFFTQAFEEVFLKRKDAAVRAKTVKSSHVFRVMAPAISADAQLCLLGQGKALNNWDAANPIPMKKNGKWWETEVDIAASEYPIGYKYALWDSKQKQLTAFEDGSNRILHAGSGAEETTILHDGFAQFTQISWRGAGIAIPVFSLRSKNSWGVGEFTDLPALADWAHSCEMRLIQLLPINDTSATDTWTDSYPYAAISAFALHPLYLNVVKLAGKTHAGILTKYRAQAQKLNELEAVDYEASLKLKWEIIRKVYAKEGTAFWSDAGFQSYYKENKHWLAPYAAFCFFKEKYGGVDFFKWPENKQFHSKTVEALLDAKSPDFESISIHIFVQWHLHCQLKEAVDYIHKKGLALKGDIPIGIYRYSCDAWFAPELYNMDQQAGAPPDDFAVNGQNWGFPTYNWERMQEDGFKWWQQRFEQMSLYFDAFRIDHILGFFRIWSIPLDAVQGILGQFVPAIPVTEQEFRNAGLGFDYERLCTPWISDQVLWDVFGDQAEAVKHHFLNAGQAGRYTLRKEFASQRQVETYFAERPQTEEHTTLREGLYQLIANVILLPVNDRPVEYAFAIGMEKTSSYQHLDPQVRQVLKGMYLNYFYKRQDDFWEGKAMEKLPALKRATNMLICGEDLGMVPDCVPGVMQKLGFLSLEIQRMPKEPGITFFEPRNAPYLSVVTPSTHDMSTVRGWWEEDRDLSQRFYNEVLGQWGGAPYFCEPWINELVVLQHLHAPSMWAIFQLQDLMGIDGLLRRESPEEERINVPANPKHYWRYRMHISLEDLQKESNFNGRIRGHIVASGRGY